MSSPEILLHKGFCLQRHINFSYFPIPEKGFYLCPEIGNFRLRLVKLFFEKLASDVLQLESIYFTEFQLLLNKGIIRKKLFESR